MTGHKYTSSLSFFLWGNKKTQLSVYSEQGEQCLLSTSFVLSDPLFSLGGSVPGVIAGMREMPGLPNAAPNWKREGNAPAVFVSGVY